MNRSGEGVNFLMMDQTHELSPATGLVPGSQTGRPAMTIRLIAVAFALTLASSAQAFPLAPVSPPDATIIQVRAACGAGMHRVNGVCVRTHARRAAGRC